MHNEQITVDDFIDYCKQVSTTDNRDITSPNRSDKTGIDYITE